MKNNILILTVFSLALSSSFISRAQKIDSSSAQTKVENKTDSTIVKKRLTHGGTKVYTMNGGKISNRNLVTRLLIFNSSALEYKKSRNLASGSGLSFASCGLGVMGYFMYFMTGF